MMLKQLTLSTISFENNRNKRGSGIEPWGTPHTTELETDVWLLYKNNLLSTEQITFNLLLNVIYAIPWHFRKKLGAKKGIECLTEVNEYTANKILIIICLFPNITRKMSSSKFNGSVLTKSNLQLCEQILLIQMIEKTFAHYPLCNLSHDWQYRYRSVVSNVSLLPPL